MKPEEKLLFETFLSTHPAFLNLKRLIPRPEPPDVIATDSSARKIGIELTEWLDKRQTTPSVADQENQMRWLSALDTEHRDPPKSFQYAQIWFRSGMRFSKQEELSFCQEFYRLAAYVDDNWEREMAGKTQKIWNDFNRDPTSLKHLIAFRSEYMAPLTPAHQDVRT